MSQSRPYNRSVREKDDEFEVNIPQPLALALDLEKGQAVAIDEDGGIIRVHVDPDDAPTYAVQRRIRCTKEYTVNIPMYIAEEQALTGEHNVDWGEPDDGIVELTPTEEVA